MPSEILTPCPEDKFYGNTVKHQDDSASFKGITVFSFDEENFYVTQNSPNTDEVQIHLRNLPGEDSGEANTASNLGLGEGVFAQKVGVDLQFKSLVAGDGVNVSSTSDEITVNSTVTGFYLNVGQTDDTPTFKDINTIKFNRDKFYVTQNSPNTDEVQVNLRFDRNPSKTAELNLTPGAAAQTVITNIPKELSVTLASVEVLNAFNGTPSLTLGFDTDTDRIMEATEVDLEEAGFRYITLPGFRATDNTDIKAYFTVGGATQGICKILLTYS